MGMTSKEYFGIKDRESYSSAKLFDSDRIKYYKKYISKEFEEEELSTSMKLGSLVDCLLFSPQEFDDRFHIAVCLKGSGQLWDFVESLCALTVGCLDEDLKVTRDMKELMEEAFNDVKYDKKGAEVKFKGKDFSWLVANFTGSEAEAYYKECRQVFGKIVVDMNEVNAANKILEELRTCEFTKDVVNAKTAGNIEVFDQEGILFEVKATPMKAMPDRIVVDHPAKIIYPYDLKVSYIGEQFQFNYWKMKYYLQIGSYDLGIRFWAKNKGLEGYTIAPMKFIVASSNLTDNPLIFETDSKNIAEGLNGFTLPSGKKYKGLYELIDDINWHKKSQLWRNSREVYENKGIMKIRPFAED